MDMTLMQAVVVMALVLTGMCGWGLRRWRRVRPERVSLALVARPGPRERLMAELRAAPAPARSTSAVVSVVERDQSVAQQRADLVEKIKQLQSRVMNAERELDELRSESSQQQDLLRTQAQSLHALQGTSADVERLRHALAEAELALATASAEHAARERTAATSAAARLGAASRRIRWLGEQVNEGVAVAERASMAVEHALTLEAEAAALAGQVDVLLQTVDDRDRHIADLETVASGRQRIDALRATLDDAQQRTTRAGTNDLQLRRLRSELAALQRRELTASTSVQELGQAGRDITALEQRVAAQLSHAGCDSGRAHRPGHPRKAKRRTSHKPLFETYTDQDDLKRIKGIGPAMERVLNGLGVTTLEQIASFTPEDVARVSREINTFPNRIERDDWIGGAQRALQQGAVAEP